MAEELMKPDAYKEWYESTVAQLQESAEKMTSTQEQQ